jgi:ribonuclease Y
MRQAGEQAAYDAAVPGLHPELIKLLGRLKYRTSYGQNVLNHCIETARLAGLLAAEIGANVGESKKGGLLHDIGKAVDHEVEGPHAAIGADIAARYGVNRVVCNSIAAHHQEVEQESVEATVVQIADAISASRPGARGESLDNYVKRLDDLQQIALSFPGVERCYAIQAGREIRVLVRPEDIDDLASSRFARLGSNASSAARSRSSSISDGRKYPRSISFGITENVIAASSSIRLTSRSQR